MKSGLNQFLSLLLLLIPALLRAQTAVIPVETKDHVLLLQEDQQERIRTTYFGSAFTNQSDYQSVASQFHYDDANDGIYNAAYTPSGTWSLTEPAIEVKHADGNSSLELKYQSHTQQKQNDASTETRIVLKDPNYNFQVTLVYKAWAEENVIEQWTEIQHKENGAVMLEKYASADLYFTGDNFYLTSYHGRWAKEMQGKEEKLENGRKIIDSKLGTRAMLLQSPNFILSFDQPASENEGKVILGQLAWSGNFKLDFEVDTYDNLKFLAGINPYNSAYALPANQVFKTPSLIYAISNHGTGEASRGLHRWARKYRVLDGQGERLTLLNNWEATYFDFDEDKITGLFKDAKELGVDMFLLDDGWFANKYPRNSDRSGLGDWQENVKKLPSGIGHLVKEATKEGIKFGIWIEPEMVNPKSELYEQHLDWVIRQPDRPEVYYRNQLVLDLSNPEVQDFVFGVVDKLFTENPQLAFIKWDCNAVIYNAYSVYLAEQEMPQSQLYVDYVKGLYAVLERVRTKYPKVPIMLCSGGGGRGDYEALKYFTEFWPSDDTDPLERIFMQWDYSYFFPSIVTCNHVTDWGKQPIKFRVDVASMGKLGFDIVFSHLSEDEKVFCKQAVKNYDRFKEIIWHGDQYRLVNPHENDFSAVMYVNESKEKAVFFGYFISQRQRLITDKEPIKFNGLNPEKLYTIKEINLFPGKRSPLDSEKVYSGDFLMKAGYNPMINAGRTSVVLEIEERK
ncbi:alpha-galactosidase [Jiulongibacter sediminis]|uniref:Alpha-galactosidase n=2 Tax=Jiulongibacter sediminis TaxID=1605367 RepID=A0A0P7BRB8_9BACT|nr:alpha-galactosidase [Jiulongibacter sediminis]TBX21705.1 alpha-galactosidase [Jiulongibacter sediminis]